jgi:uncharacterized membrane protein
VKAVNFYMMKKDTKEANLTFHWGYIILPLAIFILSVILIAFFYRLLPSEVAYKFQSDDSPEKWLSRNAIILWTIIPQLIFVILAGAITMGMSMLSRRFIQPGSTGIKPERVISLMGNMVVLPQLILCFAMLDIFSYNSYQVHLLPLWTIALIVVIIGSIILGVLFFQTIRQAQRVIKE